LADIRWKYENCHRPYKLVHHVANLIQELERAGITKLACVGYGSGAEHVVPLALAGAVDAWAIVHGRASRKLALLAMAPGIVQCASNDTFLSDRDRDTVQTLFKARRDHGRFQVRFYPDTYHGFAIRGDPRSPGMEAVKEEVFSSTVDFLDQSLLPQTEARYPRALMDYRRARAMARAAQPPQLPVS
jgi:dienelactone hydrolase